MCHEVRHHLKKEKFFTQKHKTDANNKPSFKQTLISAIGRTPFFMLHSNRPVGPTLLVFPRERKGRKLPSKRRLVFKFIITIVY